MDSTTFSQNFEVKIVGYKFNPDGQKDMSGNVLSDSADVAWSVKCLPNEYTKVFTTAVNVLDKTWTPQQISQEAWKNRKHEVYEWASSVISISPLIGQTFIPE